MYWAAHHNVQCTSPTTNNFPSAWEIYQRAKPKGNLEDGGDICNPIHPQDVSGNTSRCIRKYNPKFTYNTTPVWWLRSVSLSWASPIRSVSVNFSRSWHNVWLNSALFVSGWMLLSWLIMAKGPQAFHPPRASSFYSKGLFPSPTLHWNIRHFIEWENCIYRISNRIYV